MLHCMVGQNCNEESLMLQQCCIAWSASIVTKSCWCCYNAALHGRSESRTRCYSGSYAARGWQRNNRSVVAWAVSSWAPIGNRQRAVDPRVTNRSRQKSMCSWQPQQQQKIAVTALKITSNNFLLIVFKTSLFTYYICPIVLIHIWEYVKHIHVFYETTQMYTTQYRRT